MQESNVPYFSFILPLLILNTITAMPDSNALYNAKRGTSSIRNTLTISHSTNAMFINLNALPTSAMAITEKVMTNAPSVVKLLATAPLTPKLPG